MSLEFPELIDRIRLFVLELSDLGVIRIVLIGPRKMAQSLFERRDRGLVGPTFLQLRQGLRGQIFKRDPVLPCALRRRHCRRIKRDAYIALDRRQRLELGQRRNVDMQHRPLSQRRPAQQPTFGGARSPFHGVGGRHHMDAGMPVIDDNQISTRPPWA